MRTTEMHRKLFSSILDSPSVNIFKTRKTVRESPFEPKPNLSKTALQVN